MGNSEGNRTTAPAIQADGLAKAFDGVRALDGVSFEVRPREIFGFLGPNGAGKTTAINILTGLARPDAGTAVIGGLDVAANPGAAQELMGVVPDESNLYPELTGFANLAFCGALYGMPKAARTARAEELLDAFGLAEAASRKFGGYSKGMKRRLAIAAGIIHRPGILFLDEPTTGVDVASARKIRALISDLRKAGTTIFLTTHYIEEAERLCDRIAVIVSGRIVRVDTVDGFLQPVKGRHALRIAWSGEADGLEEKLARAFPDLEFSVPGRGVVRVEAGEPVRVGPLVRFVEDNGGEVAEARRMRPSLEDVFVRVTGIEAEAMRKEKAKGKGRSRG